MTLLAQSFAHADTCIGKLERRLAGDDAPPLEVLVEDAIGLLRALIDAVLVASGRSAPPSGADLLEAFKQLARGTPSWNAIRDNLRELVYYRNCLVLGRRDALPAAAERMTLRTVRHVTLYMRSRCETEGLL
jgi:hypothetical protein